MVIAYNIFLDALHLLNIDEDSEQCVEFSDRAPYLIASVSLEAWDIDKLYRQVNGLANQPIFNPTGYKLNDFFPLADRFIVPAGFYVASMLISDTNMELGDHLFDKYCQSMSKIVESLPGDISQTKNVYW